MAVLSGAIFFAEYAGEQNAWIYSLTYNISYLGPNVLFCMLISCIPGMTRLVDMIKKEWGNQEFVISYVGHVIGSHTGPGVIALYFFGVPRENWQG